MPWIKYWNDEPTIYVNARHLDAHYVGVAHDVIANIETERPRILDFGCGDALHANVVALKCSHVYLCDAATKVRARLVRRFSASSRITVLAPRDLVTIASGSLDLIVMNSVLQYLGEEDRAATLAEFRRLMAPNGRLIIADVIPRDVGPVADAGELMRFAARNGFACAAAAGLVRTGLSGYWRTRARLGLAKFDAHEVLAILAAQGLSGRRIARNFGHNRRRMAFEAVLQHEGRRAAEPALAAERG